MIKTGFNTKNGGVERMADRLPASRVQLTGHGAVPGVSIGKQAEGLVQLGNFVGLNLGYAITNTITVYGSKDTKSKRLIKYLIVLSLN